MWLLHKNYAVTTKLSNPASIVPKCPKDTYAPVPKCPVSQVWSMEVWSVWVWSVLGPKCLYTFGTMKMKQAQLAWKSLVMPALDGFADFYP